MRSAARALCILLAAALTGATAVKAQQLDQTDPESKRIAISHPETLGSAVVMMNMPTHRRADDTRPTRVVVLKDVTYPQAIELGSKAAAFKWVAQPVASYEVLLKQRAATIPLDATTSGSASLNCCYERTCSRCCALAELCFGCECW